MFDYKQYLPFHTSPISPTVQTILARLQVMPLGPGEEFADLFPLLDGLTVDGICPPEERTDDELAQCCLSGLWLGCNYLERAHVVTQGLHSSSARYWHALMHRREPDYGNSAYWFRKAAEHTQSSVLFPSLLSSLLTACKKEFPDCSLSKLEQWSPQAFNDLCEQSVGDDVGDGDEEEICMQIQLLEWCILFTACYDGARAEAIDIRE